MSFDDFEQRRKFHEAWEAVRIERSVQYSLFTFGESDLPYYLVCGATDVNSSVSITHGEVLIRRPMIITRDNAHPQFQGFFEDQEEEGMVKFLLARSAQFSNLQFKNQSGAKRTVADSMDAAVEKLNRKLDAEDDDRVAILSAPPHLASVAVLRYAAERVWKSGPDNVQELRERGFLP